MSATSEVKPDFVKKDEWDWGTRSVKTVDLVVSAYKADLGWLVPMLGKVSRVFLYDKGDRDLTKDQWERPEEWMRKVHYIQLPNVGKNDHTYLYHIVQQYDGGATSHDLTKCGGIADWTVFSPDHPFDHMGQLADGSVPPFDGMLVPHHRMRNPFNWHIPDWGADGRLAWDRMGNRPDPNGTNWAERYANGKITRAQLSFAEWAKEFTDCDIFSQWPGYHPGCILGIPREAIVAHPKQFYQRMLDEVSGSVEPEQGHYLERLWSHIFSYGYPPLGQERMERVGEEVVT